MIVTDFIQGETIELSDKIVRGGQAIDLTGAALSVKINSANYYGNLTSLSATSSSPTTGAIQATIPATQTNTMEGLYRYSFKAVVSGKTYKKIGYFNVRFDC